MAERSVAISACELQQRWLQVLKRLAVKQKPALALDVIALSCHLCLREAAKNWQQDLGTSGSDAEGCFGAKRHRTRLPSVHV